MVQEEKNKGTMAKDMEVVTMTRKELNELLKSGNYEQISHTTGDAMGEQKLIIDGRLVKVVED